MIVLAVDTSSPQGSLALAQVSESKKSVKVIDQMTWTESSHHSDILTSQVQAILMRNGIELGQVQAVACGLGPGSFTGLRVAINFVRSLAYALDIPIVSLNSLNLIALNALPELQSFQKESLPPTVLCLVNAFRNMVYFATYEVQRDQTDQPLVEVIPPRACRPEELASLLSPFASSYLGLGNGFGAYAGQLPSALMERLDILDQAEKNFPQAQTLAQWALKYGKIGPWSDTKPLYIRASEPEEKLKIKGK